MGSFQQLTMTSSYTGRPGAGFRDRSVNTRYLNDGDDSLCDAHALVTDKSHDIMAACGKFDHERTGKVSKHDLRRILFNELQIFPSHMDELMKTVDTDGRGEVVFGEWLSNYNRGLPSSLTPPRSRRTTCLYNPPLYMPEAHLRRFMCRRFWTSSRAGVQRHKSMSHR